MSAPARCVLQQQRSRFSLAVRWLSTARARPDTRRAAASTSSTRTKSRPTATPTARSAAPKPASTPPHKPPHSQRPQSAKTSSRSPSSPSPKRNGPPPTSNATSIQPSTTSAPPALNDINSYGPHPHATPSQHALASSLFKSCQLLTTSPYFRDLPSSSLPEVVFLGRSNVGKSSLINGLLGKVKEPLARVSKTPGFTQTINTYGVGEVVRGRRKVLGKDGALRSVEEWMCRGQNNGPKGNSRTGRGRGKALVLVDTPGYGKASREEWGKEVMKYLTKREQLCRAFVLIDAKHGPLAQDEQIIRLLGAYNVPHQIVLTKMDRLTGEISDEISAEEYKKLDEIHKRAFESIRNKLEHIEEYDGGFHEVLLACSTLPKMTVGLDGVRWGVMEACGLFNEEGKESGKVGGRAGEPIKEDLWRSILHV